MSAETLSRLVRPRRVELLTREHGLLEAGVLMHERQALAPYLNSRGTGVELVDARSVASGETHEQLLLRQAEVIHARPLEVDVPVVQSVPQECEQVAVEVTLGSGEVVRGRFLMTPGQTIGEHLGLTGTFAVLMAAQVDGPDSPPADLVMNQYAMQSVRDVSEPPTRREWHRGGTAAAGARVHWLLRTAREQGIAGCDTLQFPPSTPVREVWAGICAAAPVTEADLAAAVGRRLRMRVATAAEMRAVPPEHDLPDTLLERYGVRVLPNEGRTLAVATADPMDADAEQALAFAAKRSIAFVLAPPSLLDLRPTEPTPDIGERPGERAAASSPAAQPDPGPRDEVEATEPTSPVKEPDRGPRDEVEAAEPMTGEQPTAQPSPEAAPAEAPASPAPAAESVDRADAAAREVETAHRTGTDTQAAAAAQRRSEMVRALLHGLDRCVADGRSSSEVLGFACEQLAHAFAAPLVWIATLEGDAPEIRACAGACAPHVRDVVPRWADLASGDDAVSTAIRARAPQATRLDDEPAFERWREHTRAYDAPLLLVVPVLDDGAAVAVLGLHTRNMHWLDRDAGVELLNVSERIGSVVQRLRQLEAADVQLSAFELAADAVFLTDRDGVIRWVNRAFVELSGYTAEEAVGRRPDMLRSARHDADFFREIWETILAGQPWRGELYNLHRDGRTYAVEQTITPVLNRDDEVTHFLSVQRDITERRQRERSVRLLFTRDAMTGLPNARAFGDELARRVATAAKGAPPAALLLVHAEGVAQTAQAAGEAAGHAEALARVLATALRETLRPEDYLARLGDFEFAALLADTPNDGALVAAERLRAAAAARFSADAEGHGIVRIGVAHVDGTQSGRAVLAIADAALYGGRRSGSGDILTHAGGSADGAAVGAEWTDRIRGALRDGRFLLHFQPVMRLSTRTLAHCDALLRLQDENGEMVPARAFIMHAENLGLMAEIDRWVVENVMRLLQTSPDVRVSLNVSAATVMSAGFRQFMQRQSGRMAAVGARMIFEVAEVQAVENLPCMVDSMNHLRELGCRFALDNFGMSEASLASLGTLPVDYVKLDGSLITGIDVDEHRYELTRALTGVVRALGREVIAGCAERAGILEVLPELGIDMAQGNYVGTAGPELRRDLPGRTAGADGAGHAVLLATADGQPRLSN